MIGRNAVAYTSSYFECDSIYNRKTVQLYKQG